MSGKCEHGLTTKECLVCASAKYPAAPQQAQETSLPPQGAASLLKFVQHCSTLSGGMVNGNILATEAMKALAASPAPAPQEPAQVYRHYKGGLYEVVAMANEESTGTPLVVYRSQEDSRVWARPLREWLEKFTHVSGPAPTETEGASPAPGELGASSTAATTVLEGIAPEYDRAGVPLGGPLPQQAPSESSAQGSGGEKV